MAGATTAAAAAINLQELEQELTRTRGMFEQWSNGVLSRAHACKASHTAKMRASKGELTALTERYQRAEKQAAQVRHQMAQDTQHEHALQTTADSLVAEQHALQKRLAQLQLECESDTTTVQQLESEVSRTQADLHERLATLDKLHDAYQNSLGLRLEPRDGDMYLEFTQIDPCDPSKPFGFAVRSEGKNDFAVTRCEPEVPARHELEARLLGARGDFAGFVRCMRAEFRRLAEAGGQPAGGDAA